MELTERQQRVHATQTFIHQFIMRELFKRRELLKIRKQIIQTLGRMLHEEIIASGILLQPGQIGIRMIGSGFEIHFATDESKAGAPIFSLSYLDMKPKTFPKNDPSSILRVIQPFMEEILSKSGNEILGLVDEMEKENE